ncbi:MAG: GNAT family N-acetyltransferase [Clostridiales bacterium]|nr:GNAT family N-acetyltransferase [Clostridiales bacterium]
MNIVKFPENIDKTSFLAEYADRILSCLKVSMESSFKQILTLTPESDESWYKYLKLNLDKGVRYIMIEDSGSIKGYLVWYFQDDEVQFYDLIIHPDYQCDGSTLRKLLTIFANDIKDKGFAKIVAYTNIKNDRMNKLLIKRGFEVRQVRTRGTEYYIDINKFLNKFNR